MLFAIKVPPKRGTYRQAIGGISFGVGEVRVELLLPKQEF
jgi:hypothetical protein